MSLKIGAFLLTLQIFAISVLRGEDANANPVNGSNQDGSLSLSKDSELRKKLCEKMSDFSCRTLDVDDGTGAVKSVITLEDEKAQINKKVKNLLENEFEKKLFNPDGSLSRFGLIGSSAFGLNYDDKCELIINESKNSNRFKDEAYCKKKLMRQAVHFAQKNNFNIVDPVIPSPTYIGNLEDLTSIFSLISYQSILSGVKKEMIKEYDEKLNKIKEDFDIVKKLIKLRVDKMNMNGRLKTEILTKLDGIEFDSNDCQETEDQENKISVLFIPGAFYNPARNSIKYCNGFIQQSDSQFKFAFTIAHELAHSFDPCKISESSVSNYGFKYKTKPNFSSTETEKESKLETEKEYPIPDILTCLRGNESIQAKYLFLNDGSNKDEAKKNELEETKNSIIGSDGRFTSFCHNDQIGESFSDWLGAEILSDYMSLKFPNLSQEDYIKGVSNIFRNMCNMDPKNFDVHPYTRDRIDRIIMANPELRAKMGCPALHKYKYCEVKNLPVVVPDQISPFKEAK